jgi:hypothetical protein
MMPVSGSRMTGGVVFYNYFCGRMFFMAGVGIATVAGHEKTPPLFSGASTSHIKIARKLILKEASRNDMLSHG